MTRAQRTRLVASRLVLLATLLVAGCGSDDSTKVDGREIAAVRSCLKAAGFDVTGLERGDVKLVDGVSGTKRGGDPSEIAYAGAGHARRDEDVRAFRKSTSKAQEQQSAADKARLTIDAGTSGRYVWAVGGVTGSKGLAAARKCVEPKD